MLPALRHAAGPAPCCGPVPHLQCVLVPEEAPVHVDLRHLPNQTKPNRRYRLTDSLTAEANAEGTNQSAMVLWVLTAEANRRYQSINPPWDSVLSNPIRTNVSLRCGPLNRGYTKLSHEPSHSLTPYSHAFAGGDATDANKQTGMLSGVPACPSIRKGKATTARLHVCDAKADW